MPFSVKPHPPLISTRIEFQINHLPPPPSTTLRQDLGRHVKRRIQRKKTPYDRRIPNESEHSSHDEGSSLSSLSDDGLSEDEEVTVARKNKIQKPPGEAGRRNSGGFNLEKVLGWEVERYNDMIKYVNGLVVRKLDPQKCFSRQKLEAIKDVIREVVRKFKIEDAYFNDWPIREALKLRLKYTSEAARKQHSRKTEKTLKKAVMEAHAMRRDSDHE